MRHHTSCLAQMHSAHTIFLPAYQLPTSGQRKQTYYCSIVIQCLGMSVGLSKGSLLGSKSPSEIFKVVESKQRDQVVKVLNQDDVSLGMVDPVTGR